MEETCRDWQQFNADYPGFPSLYHRAFQLVPKLILDTPSNEFPDAVVLQLMSASLPDLDDILLLCSQDRLWGALKLMRSLFERTVTLKHLAQNKSETAAFLKYDAVDWDAILSGIQTRFQLTANPKTMKHFRDAAKEVKSQLKRCEKMWHAKAE